MSSGDIDDKLGDAEELAYYRQQNQRFNDYLEGAYRLVPVRTFFIPFGAGISTDGQRVYISYDIATIVQGTECFSALVRHETTEWGLREFFKIGEYYESDPHGHRLANRAEHDRVVQLLARGEIGWELYTEIIDPQVVLAERQDLNDKPVPKDLALYPYEDEMIEKINEAVLNDRSEEEWLKL